MDKFAKTTVRSCEAPRRGKASRANSYSRMAQSKVLVRIALLPGLESVAQLHVEDALPNPAEPEPNK
jgi:hypothetical protein